MTESAARRVLKELLIEFDITASDLKKKINLNEDKIRYNKMETEKSSAILKKLQDQCRSVETFTKRLTIAEVKVEAVKENTTKQLENIQLYIAKTKDMLEAKVE